MSIGAIEEKTGVCSEVVDAVNHADRSEQQKQKFSRKISLAPAFLTSLMKQDLFKEQTAIRSSTQIMHGSVMHRAELRHLPPCSFEYRLRRKQHSILLEKVEAFHVSLGNMHFSWYKRCVDIRR